MLILLKLISCELILWKVDFLRVGNMGVDLVCRTHFYNRCDIAAIAIVSLLFFSHGEFQSWGHCEERCTSSQEEASPPCTHL